MKKNCLNRVMVGHYLFIEPIRSNVKDATYDIKNASARIITRYGAFLKKLANNYH